MCGKTGALVSSKTVESLVLEVLDKNELYQEIMSLCMDKECEMAYFSADYGYLFLQRNIKVPLDYKNDVVERYACYCKNITVNDVIKAVKKEGVRNIKELFRYQTPIITAECKEKNPFGFCCMPDINKMIEEILLGIEV